MMGPVLLPNEPRASNPMTTDSWKPDYHCHTTFSDGVLDVPALVARAHEKGVTSLAITDHDTIAGLAHARPLCAELGMELISGIELSCQWQGLNIHVVGLAFDDSHPVIVAMEEDLHRRREERAKTIAQRLEKAGFPGLLEKAKAQAGQGQIGRPHFARAMVEAGFVKDMTVAFKKHLGAGKPGDVKAEWPEFPEAIGWIKAAGGIAVLAHPDKYKLTRSKLLKLIESFVAAGGEAVEVVGPQLDPNFQGSLVKTCEKYALKGSLGSDFHNPCPWSELGRLKPLPSALQPVWAHWRTN